MRNGTPPLGPPYGPRHGLTGVSIGSAFSNERGCPFVPAEPASFSDEVGSSVAESGGRGGDEESEL